MSVNAGSMRALCFLGFRRVLLACGFLKNSFGGFEG